jgi:hypothetical protein
MYLNVILTIFLIVQVSICGCIIYWWKKYGKKLLTSFTELKKSFLTPNSKSPLEGMPDFGKMMSEINNMTKNMKNFK